MHQICVRILLLSALFWGCVSCGGGGDDKPGGALRIAVVPKGTTHEFWKAIHAGAVKAEQELNADGPVVEVIWRGPLREDDRQEQIKVMENFTANKVDGIVLAPLDENALVTPVEHARAIGVPVAIIDSGIATEEYVSFISTDNYQGGVMAARELARLLDGHGNVMVLRYQVGSASTTKREEGFLKTIREFENISVISDDQYAGATRSLAYDKAQNLFETLGGELDGIFCPNETVTIGVVKALRDIQKAGGKVKVIGFDTSRDSLLDMKNGDLQGLIVQDPINMGYQGVLKIVAHIKGENIEKRIDTGVSLVTRENMEEPRISELLNPPIDRYLR